MIYDKETKAIAEAYESMQEAKAMQMISIGGTALLALGMAALASSNKSLFTDNPPKYAVANDKIVPAGFTSGNAVPLYVKDGNVVVIVGISDAHASVKSIKTGAAETVAIADLQPYTPQ